MNTHELSRGEPPERLECSLDVVELRSSAARFELSTDTTLIMLGFVVRGLTLFP